MGGYCSTGRSPQWAVVPMEGVVCKRIVFVIFSSCPESAQISNDIICHVFSDMTVKYQRFNFTSLIEKCYESCFGCKVGHQDKSWAHRICCSSCVNFLK
jgi:uncharacterized protein YjaG (DUF416 family)